MTEKTYTTAQPAAEDEMLRAALLEPVPLPDGLTDSLVRDWRSAQPRRLRWWFRGPPEAGPKFRVRTVALAASVAIGLLAMLTLIAGPDPDPADQLMAPDALAELSGGLL